MEQTIVMIPAKSREEIQRTKRLKVAAYCRVSTDEEEQETSYEAQISYYTYKIKITRTGRLRAFLRTREFREHRRKNAPNF